MSTQNFRRYQTQKAAEDFFKFRGEVISAANPVRLNGVASIDLEPGRIVVADSNIATPLGYNNVEGEEYGFLFDWAYPTVALTATSLFGIVERSPRERYDRPQGHWQPLGTVPNDGDIIRAGESFSVITRGFIWTEVLSDTINFNNSVFVNFGVAGSEGKLEIVTSANNTDISSKVRFYSAKNTVIGGNRHCAQVFIDSLLPL